MAKINALSQSDAGRRGLVSAADAEAMGSNATPSAVTFVADLALAYGGEVESHVLLNQAIADSDLGVQGAIDFLAWVGTSSFEAAPE
jgi:hypothetical protein